MVADQRTFRFLAGVRARIITFTRAAVTDEDVHHTAPDGVYGLTA